MVVTQMSSTTHTPPQSHDERRNLRNKTRGSETRLIGLRTAAMRAQTQKIDRIAKKLCNKPGVVARLEQTLADCNEKIRVAVRDAEKFANRKESSNDPFAKRIVRGADSVEFGSVQQGSIEQGGNG